MSHARRIAVLGLARVVLPVGAGEKQRRVDQPPRWRATLAQRKGRQRSSARALVSAPAAREDEDEEHEAVPRSRLCDEFEPLSRFLGRGGFASVVSARHRLDGREYAIKLVALLDDAPREAAAEASAMAQIGPHENVVPYFTSWLERFSPRLRATVAAAPRVSQRDDCEASTTFDPSSSEEEPGSSSDEEPRPERAGWRLCIQLGLCCDGSLREWLRRRGAERSRPGPFK